MTEKLIDGYHQFYFKNDNSLFETLKTGQSPNSVMISCSDSRVDGAILTNAAPGDIFTIRNVANLVPPYDKNHAFNDAGGASVGAAIEFAVCVLKVKNIIVMGHSQCGGVKALMTHDETKESDFEYIPQWMNIAKNAKEKALQQSNNHDDIDELCQHGEQQVILLSLQNLMSYPFIESRVKSGDLSLHGWYFSIADGMLYAHDKAQDKFIAKNSTNPQKINNNDRALKSQRDNYAKEPLLMEEPPKTNEILSLLKNNNSGLEEQDIKKLVRFYLAQDKSITEIEQAIKNYEQLKQDFVKLTGDSPKVNEAMNEAQNHIDNLQFDDAIIAIDYALSLENQDIARAEDNYRDIIINRAKKYELKANIANQKFDFEQARDDYIDAYQTISYSLSHNQCNNDIRQIQSHYLHYITTNSLDAGLYNDDKTNHYAKLAVEFAQQHFGDKHPDTLTSINNLAGLYESQGRYEEAEPLYIEALEKRTEILGRDHPSTLTYINNIAGLYQAQGRYDNAKPLYIEALEKRTEILGRDHPDTLISINNLAVLYEAQGRYEDAELLHQEELETCTRILGRDHPDTLISINNLAGLYESQGRFEEAEPLYIEALAGYKKIFPNGHPHIDIVEENLEILKKAMGDVA